MTAVRISLPIYQALFEIFMERSTRLVGSIRVSGEVADRVAKLTKCNYD